MKLVDILARELKVWPHGGNALGQAADTTLHLNEGASHGSEFYGWTKEKFTRAEDHHEAFVTRAQWQAAVDALKGVEWNGEGLPPVGTHVVVHDDGSLVYGQGESGEVLAHVDGCAVIRMSYGLGCFLPRCIRTPEQIAAEERENELNRMVATVSMLDKGWARKVCAALYDANYRKQEDE